jgi:arsenate reductase (thioredoxin)
MKEVGINISSNQKSKIITEDMIRDSKKSVNMGCIERGECPLLFVNNKKIIEEKRASVRV